MKKFSILLILFVFIANTGNVFSQELSSKEKKSLKKEIRKLLKDPVKYKFLKESLVVKETIVNEQSKEINLLTRESNKLKHELKVARDSIGEYAYAIKAYKESEIKNAGNNCTDDSGMKFRLQIGLYREFDITSFLEQFKLLSFEITDDGMYRYTIGNFDNEIEAESFKEAMRKMGIKDAFVSFYLDGKRIPKY